MTILSQDIVHPVIAQAIAEWLKNPESEAKITNPHKRGMVRKLAKGNCPESILGFVASDLVKASGMDLCGLCFQAAKQDVVKQWGGEDKLSYLTCYSQVISGFQIVCDEIGVGKLADLFKAHKNLKSITDYFTGRRKSGVGNLKKMLMVIYCHKNGLPMPEPESGYTERIERRRRKKIKSPKMREGPKDVMSDTTVRYAVNSAFATISSQVTLLVKILAEHGQVVNDGDRVRATGFANNLLKALRITPEFINNRRRGPELSEEDKNGIVTLADFAKSASRDATTRKGKKQ